MRIPLLYLLLLFYDWLLALLLILLRSVFLPFFVCYIALTTVPTHLFAVLFTSTYFNDLCPEPDPPGRLIFHHPLRVLFWGGDLSEFLSSQFYSIYRGIPRACMHVRI